MRKTVECAVAVLAAVTAVWGGARESVPSFAESAEEAKIDEELEKLKKLDRESPFPCWYADVKRAPFDSVWEIPTFLNADGSIQPCYPCAPRIVLSRFVSFDRDEDPAEFWKGDTNRLFGAFLHPMRKRSPSALSAPTFSDMEAGVAARPKLDGRWLRIRRGGAWAPATPCCRRSSLPATEHGAK